MDSLERRLLARDYYYLYDSDFLEFLRMNLADLKKQSIINSYTIEISDVDKANSDRNFNKLCNIANIPFHLHYITLLVNGYKEYTEFRSSDGPLYRVDTNYLASLKIRFDEAQSNN